MPIADRITVGNPASFSSIEPQITNGPPLSSTNAVAYNGKIWMVGGTSTVQNTTIKTYSDVVSTQFQSVLYYFRQAKQYQLSIAEDTRAHFNFPNATYIQQQIDFINTQYQTNYDAYISASADAQEQYTAHKENGDIATNFNYQTTHTLAISTDGYTWTRVDQNPFALVSYQINAPQTLEHVSRVNGLAWNGTIWLAIGDGGGVANQTTILNTAADPDNPTIPASNYNATNQLATSPDGINWTVRGRPGRMFSGLPGAPYGGGQPYGVAATSSLFMVVCGNLSGIHNRSTQFGSTLYDPFYDDVCTICKSTDGINWSKVGTSGDLLPETSNWVGYDAVGGLFQGYGVAYNGAYWVAVGAGLPDAGSSFLNNLTGSLRSCIVVSSNNGATWTQALNNYAGPNPNDPFLKTYYNIFSVAWNGSYWLAVGQIADHIHYIPAKFGEPGGKYYWAGDDKGVIITSTDSLNWTVTTGFPVFTTVAWDGNYWIVSGQIGIDYNNVNQPIGITKRSRDGVNWELLGLSGNAVATKIPLPILGGSVNTVSSLIVGFGTPMSILRSFDDVSWYPQLTDGYGTNFSGSIQKEFRKVLWTGSSWIVVGKPQYGRYGQCILTSPNALTWTYPENILEDGRDVAWNGSLAVAVGNGSVTDILTSPNLVTWTPRTSDRLVDCNCVAWNGTKWAIGGNGGINTSTNGETWTRAIKCSLTNVNGIAWNGFNWLAVGYGPTTTIVFSVDGIRWYDVATNPFDTGCNQVAWNGNLWVAVGNSTNTIATSVDGYNWIGRGKTIFAREGTSISWTGTLWLATGTGEKCIASSPDGIIWTSFSIQLTRGNSYANKTITLPYAPNEEPSEDVAAAVGIVTNLTNIDIAAEVAAAILLEDEEESAAAAEAALIARNATKAAADIAQTKLLYWKNIITKQYTPLTNTTIVDLSLSSLAPQFEIVLGAYNTITENVRLMTSYYNFIYDDTNGQFSINEKLKLLQDLVVTIDSIIVDFFNSARTLYVSLSQSNLDSRDISGIVTMITNWGFPTTTRNVALTAFNNGATVYNSEFTNALALFNTPVTTVTYTHPSSSNAPDFSAAFTTLETAASVVIYMSTIFKFAYPYKQAADEYRNKAIADVISWATILQTTPNTAAVTTALAPYYKTYFYSPSYEAEDNPPPTAPTMYILDIGQTFGVASYGDSSVIIQHTINKPKVGLQFFKTISANFSSPGAYPSILTALYSQMKTKFDELNGVKTAALNFATNLRNTTIKNKLTDFKTITRRTYTDALQIDGLINDIRTTSFYSTGPYEKCTQTALLAKAGSLLYPTLFPLKRAVHIADAEAEADGCIAPLRGWGSASNGVPLSELGTQGVSGWVKYNNTIYTRNALSACISLNSISGSSAVINGSSTTAETFLQNYYTLYGKALSWKDFMKFTDEATYNTMTDAWTTFKATLLELQSQNLFLQSTANTKKDTDIAAIESKYASAATEYLVSLVDTVALNIPSVGDMALYGYLPFTSPTVTGSTFAGAVADINADNLALINIKNTSMVGKTNSQINTHLTDAENFVASINLIQNSLRYKQIITGIPIYNTVRANADRYKNLLQDRYDRWVNMKNNALNQGPLLVGDLSDGRGQNSIMSVPPSNTVYWKKRKFTIFDNLDSKETEECYYNVGNSTVMALPAFNNTGAAGVYRGSALYYSAIDMNLLAPSANRRISYSGATFSTNGTLCLRNTTGLEAGPGTDSDVTAFLLKLIDPAAPVGGVVRVYSISSPSKYVILKYTSGTSNASSVTLTCEVIDQGTSNIVNGDPVYVLFSDDIEVFNGINFKSEFKQYSSTASYLLGSRVLFNSLVYHCIKDNTNPVTTGINNQTPPLYPRYWTRRRYPYVLYKEKKIEASPENIPYLTRNLTIPFNSNEKYSQGDCVYRMDQQGVDHYYWCMEDIDTAGYVTGISPSNVNYWVQRTYPTGYVKGIYQELNPTNFPALVSTDFTAYSSTESYQREDYVSYNNAVYFLNVPIGILSQNQTPGGVGSPWVLITRAVAYVNSSYSFVQITSANFSPLDPNVFSQYSDTYQHFVPPIVVGNYTVVGTGITKTDKKLYKKNMFVKFNGLAYECLYTDGNLRGVETSNVTYWKEVQYPMVFYKGVFVEGFPGNIPPYEYTSDYPSRNGAALSDSSDFEVYSELNTYRKGDLVAYSSEPPTSQTLIAVLQDLSYSGNLSGLTLPALVSILMNFAPGYYEALSLSAFYECTDDTVPETPIINIPPSNQTYWKQITYPFVNHKIAGTIEANPESLAIQGDPTSRYFDIANEKDYHEYDNNWIYRVGDSVSYNNEVYECVNTVPPLLPEDITGISPLASTGHWKDVSFSGTDYDNFVAPILTDNFITKWEVGASKTYSKGDLVLWDGDIYKCEQQITYRAQPYNMLIPADATEIKTLIPPLNLGTWNLIKDYSVLSSPIPDTYDPLESYMEGDIVTLRTIADSTSTDALNAKSVFGIDEYHFLTFYKCISVDPTHPVKYFYDSFSALNELTEDGNYKLGVTYGNNTDSNVPRYIEASDDPFALPGFAATFRRNIVMYVELPYKYIKTHVEAARRGDFENYTTLIAGATRTKYNFGSLAVKPVNAQTEFNSYKTTITGIISNFDSSETANSIDDVFYVTHLILRMTLTQWRDDMVYYVNQINRMKTQYFNLPSVQASIRKNPYKYLNPVALATNTTSPGQVKLMFRDLGIGDIDEITYNLDVLRNHILSTEEERTYYNKNVVILSYYINTVNEHITAAKRLIGFSLITAAVLSTTKHGVRINCIVSNVDNVSPISIDTPITEYNGVNNYSQQRNFNDRVVNNTNILGIITYNELQQLTAGNSEGDAYYVKNFTLDYDALSPQEKQKYNDSDKHLYIYKPDATRNVVGWEQGGWVDQGKFDDPLEGITLTGYINAMMLESVRPPNYTLPSSRESAAALTLSYESQSPGMRGLTILANGVVGTVAAGFQNIWDPMALLGLINGVTGETLFEGGGLTFPNFNDRMESINLLNQLVAGERGKAIALTSGVLNYGIEEGTETSFMLGLGNLKKGVTYNFQLTNSNGVQNGLTVEDGILYTIGAVNSAIINTGKITFSNGTAASGSLGLSNTDGQTNTVTTWLASLYSSFATIKGYISIASTTQPRTFSVFSIASGSSGGSGSTAGSTIVCTLVSSQGTLSTGNIVRVKFSRNLPGASVIYDQTIVVTNNTIAITVPSGSGTASIPGIKVTTGTQSDGQYILRYKLSSNPDRDYLKLTPNLAYDATHGNGWTMLKYAATVSASTSVPDSGIHTLSEADAAITTVGKLLLLSVESMNELISFTVTSPTLVPSTRSVNVELPPISDPPIGSRPPEYIPEPNPEPTLKLKKSVQPSIDALRQEQADLKDLIKRLEAEKAAIQGRPVKLQSVDVVIPRASYDIERIYPEPAKPPRKITYRTYESGLAQLRQRGNLDAIAKYIKEGEKGFGGDVKVIAAQDVVPAKVKAKVILTQNNLEAVEAAKVRRLELKAAAKEAAIKARAVKADEIVVKAKAIEARSKDLKALTEALDAKSLEELEIQVKNSVKTEAFKNAQAAYDENVVKAEKATIERATAQAEYDEQLKKYKQSVNIRELATQKELLKARKSALTAKLNSELVSKNELKISYEVFEVEYIKHPPVRAYLKAKLYKFMEFITAFTVDDLIRVTFIKSGTSAALKASLAVIGRNVIAPLASATIKIVVAGHIAYAQVLRGNASIGNVKFPNALVERLNIISRASGVQVARALTTAAKGSSATRAIQRLPVLGVLGAGMEIYGAFMTASANGAYESAPTVLNY
jgi:hypothetical protein